MSGPVERVLMLAVPACEARADDPRAGRTRARGKLGSSELDPATERLWAEVLAAVERMVPGVEAIRSGLCAMRARGPARFYGGEAEAARALIDCVTALGPEHAMVGVARGRFAAEQAVSAGFADPGVYSPAPDIRIIYDGQTAPFLASLPVSRAAEPELAEVLIGLGASTLGALAALPESSIRQRFGQAGLLAHRRARGEGEAGSPEVQPRATVKELSVRFSFESPLNGADQLAFASSPYAEQFERGLVAQGLVCTELLVELTDDTGARSERTWSHPSRFTAADVVNRVRWQAATLSRETAVEGAGVAEIMLAPARTARAADHEAGLWSTAPDERVHHHLTRVQSLVGHEGVGTGELTGGRLSADRQRLVTWGSAAAKASALHRARDGPWPGRIIGTKPNIVFSAPFPVDLRAADDTRVVVDADGLLDRAPHRFVTYEARTATVHGWSAVWLLNERWWLRSAPVYRLQLLLESGDAWLLQFSPYEGWRAEGRYS